jgi:hypothetical protein
MDFSTSGASSTAGYVEFLLLVWWLTELDRSVVYRAYWSIGSAVG